ncbi:hypothetical protein ACJQWK_04592 [Exserohilum turcicum]|uniref:Uncharacterized protein n=1 Tax=Exserohilum turcicum (strain 28A) TaxID=671987 RepID=R0IB10_EXST2|nr:uncharacterized protein SETTUDRAFT_156330 [Exserohilum turcica Et28A]EOA82585.1 hypothetical protein SETTUDRAFT_156330 [Exserohilum turcica Et28A]
MENHTTQFSSNCSTPSEPTTPVSPASSTSSSYFNSSTEPQVPFQIIVTFDGKVREMLRIERGESAPETRKSRRTPRPRYYARSSEQPLRMD